MDLALEDISEDELDGQIETAMKYKKMVFDATFRLTSASATGRRNSGSRDGGSSNVSERQRRSDAVEVTGLVESRDSELREPPVVCRSSSSGRRGVEP